ncbi:MAG: hypothetical protein FJZ49_06350 [Candidatus Verstraetearchaeota archaeon]|nr:hypothetical protein [Candidatus Verstraetearchaeota archaeon]
MRTWKESQGEVRRVRPDKEMARSMLKMIEVRMRMMESVSREDFASLVVEGYYEVIKETLTALMALDGYKTLSHEVLVGYLKEFFPQFSESEALLVDRLRQLRNKISYMGFFVDPDYLERNERRIKEVVEKLLSILRERLHS